jgi:hypothetical protein
LLALTLALSAATALSREAHAARVIVLDDGEKVLRGMEHPLAASPWPEDIDLFAMRGETVALQVVVEADAEPLAAVRVSLGSLRSTSRPLGEQTAVLAERFVRVRRSSGADHDTGSLAFTAAAAPKAGTFVGEVADALTPGDGDAARGERTALWVDVFVPDDAAPGLYEGDLAVADRAGSLARRRVRLRVIGRSLPFAAVPVTVFYDTATLVKRMGSAAAAAERALRLVLHAHHMSAFHEVAGPMPPLDAEALTGQAFTRARGYEGPGQGLGEGTFAIGAYGALGPPSAASVGAALGLAEAIRGLGVAARTETFLYAVDERCASPLPAAWQAALALPASQFESRLWVGTTCGDDPVTQAADVVMMTADTYVPARARIAETAGKHVWVYNGRRPFAGAMMLDVPATDLRANAWIAARYGVSRWFYWEAAYWLDDGRGGRGGARGFDPFEVAETFHNADGDHANGDGILVYPGTQPLPMLDYGEPTVFASVRLKNLRRGIEDAGYIELARAVDPEAASAIVSRLVPRALALAGTRIAWPERGEPWLDARRELAEIVERAAPPPGGATPVPVVAAAPAGCAASRAAPPTEWWGLFSAAFALLLAASVRRRPRRR